MAHTMFQFCALLLVIQHASAEANFWEKLTPSGTLPTVRTAHSAVWSPDLGMLIFGGSDHTYWAYLNDLHLYRSDANSWEKLTPSGTLPTALGYHSAVWSPDLGMLIFGGYDGSSYQNDLHLYRSETNSWEELVPSGTLPTRRSGHSAVWSPGLGMLIFGGHDGSSYLNDLHLYRSETNSWEELVPSGTLPMARNYHSAVWSPDLGMLISGGYDDYPSAFSFNDLHLYFPETNSWEELTPSGTLPTAREAHSAVWSPDLGMLSFGGWDFPSSPRYYNDLHLYRCEVAQHDHSFAARSGWGVFLTGLLLSGIGVLKD